MGVKKPEDMFPALVEAGTLLLAVVAAICLVASEVGATRATLGYRGPRRLSVGP